jgi:hypothetical protein
LRFRTVNGSPCAATKGLAADAALQALLDDPKLVFFDSTKCHVPSNSNSMVSPETLGFGRSSPKSRTRHISVRLLPNARPSARNEPFAV